MEDIVWNPWHGCRKYSEGCKNCYVYRRDSSIGKDASEIKKNESFDLPVKRRKDGEYKIKGDIRVYACMTSDFFLEEADEWRNDCWSFIKERSDINFIIITKRIERFRLCTPPDWGDGYDNVTIVCTIENQRQCDIRYPIFLREKIKHKQLACEPLLGKIDMRIYLDRSIEVLVAGGESGNEARLCDYDWILDLREQCIAAGVPFYFKQTGARMKKDGKVYRIMRKYQHSQARKANINTTMY